MRVLAVGDLHGDISLAKQISKKANDEKADLVVICGDLTHFDQVPKGFIHEFVKKGHKVLFVPGNHDSETSADFFSGTYSIRNLNEGPAVYGNIAFIGAGGACVGPFPTSESRLQYLMERNFGRLESASGLKKILVTHTHPEGTLMERFTGFFKGSRALREGIEKMQPDVVLCSHVHEASGIEEKIGKTRIINVSRVGKILEL
ncbi:MAG TPA: hypothetical protein ENN46_02680 [Candidatus Woesearchaeota archaeon]|nr:hypothetical protein [Candidatus Woesearchaeota archaeon]